MEYLSKNHLFQLSCINGNLKLIQELTDYDIHDNDDQAIRIASNSNYTDLVKWLVEKGANLHTHHQEPLRAAIGNGNLELVIYLVKHGAKIDVWDYFPLTLAAAREEIEILMYLLTIANHVSSFMMNWAASEERLETLIKLSQYRLYDDDVKMVAARYGHLSIVKMLGYNYKSLVVAIKYSQPGVSDYLTSIAPKKDLFLANVICRKDISKFESEIDDICCICFEELSQGIKLECQHSYHSRCLLYANLPYCSFCLRKLCLEKFEV